MIAMLVLVIAADVSAKVTVEPARAEIGQPVVVSLIVERPSAVAVESTKIELGAQGSWMFLEALGTRREPKAQSPGTVIETTSWSAFALEGAAPLPTIEVSFTEAGAPQKITAAAPVPEIAHALREGEEEPRPPKEFRDPESFPEAAEWKDGGSRLVAFAVVLLALVVALVAFLVVRRRKLRARPAVTVSATEELERLAADARDSGANRDVVFALTRIARGAVDAATSESRAARTDQEWLALVSSDARIPETARTAATRLVERAERVKYAGEEPTRFATDEALADARAIVEAVSPRKAA